MSEPVPSDHLVVGAVVRRSDDVLMVAHRLASGELAWSLPAGGVEGYESLAQAVRRELAEETGLTLDRIRHVAYTTQASQPDRHERLLVVVFEAEAHGDLHIDDPDDEVVDVAFVPLDDAVSRLRALPWPASGGPGAAYLSGAAAAGTLWSYRSDGGPITLEDRIGPGAADLTVPLS